MELFDILIFLFSHVFIHQQNYIESTSERHQEFCMMEKLNITCAIPSEVILMASARYGRMNIGRCVHQDFGYLGCSVDILRHLDSRCSGRHVCRFQLPDPLLYELKPCPYDFTSYVEVSYRCVSVAVRENELCRKNQKFKPVIGRNLGYLASITADETMHGSVNCPWLIEVKQGQRINITLYNFMNKEFIDNHIQTSGSQQTDVCLEVAVITDGLLPVDRKPITVCEGDLRIVNLMMTKTNQATVEFINRHLLKSIGHVMIGYTAVGCSSIESVPDGWFHQNGNTVVVSCNHSSEMSWYLTCREGHWVGQIGNCSNLSKTNGKLDLMAKKDENFPYGILLMVVIGVAVGVVVGGLLLCLVVSCTKRCSSPQDRYHTTEYQSILVNPVVNYANRQDQHSVGMMPLKMKSWSPNTNFNTDVNQENTVTIETGTLLTSGSAAICKVHDKQRRCSGIAEESSSSDEFCSQSLHLTKLSQQFQLKPNKTKCYLSASSFLQQQNI